MTPTGAEAVSDVVRAASGRGAIPFARIGIALLALFALVWIGREAGGYVPRFAEWVDRLGFWGPAAFEAGYAAAVVAFVPGSVLTLAAGAIFGLVEGTAVVLIGATLGSTAAFVVSRYLARDAIARKVEGDPRFSATAIITVLITRVARRALREATGQ